MFCQKKNGIFSKIIKIYLIFLSLQLNYIVLNLLYMEFEREIYLKSAGVLAFVGDSVFSVLVRSRLTLSHELNAGQLNRLANKLVCAKAQAEMMTILEPNLTEIERDIYLRARNISPNNVPKSSTIAEYSMATALEALFGYWYLTDDKQRMDQAVNLCIGDKI